MTGPFAEEPVGDVNLSPEVLGSGVLLEDVGNGDVEAGDGCELGGPGAPQRRLHRSLAH